MKIHYSIYQGESLIGEGLIANEVQEIHKVMKELNQLTNGIPFRAVVVEVKTN